MHKIVTGLFGAAALLASPALAAPKAAGGTAAVSIKDAKAFMQTLAQMGYSPTDYSVDSDLPSMSITINGSATSVMLVGCVKEKNCSYIYLSSFFTDVKNPSQQWLLAENDKFDILKVSTNDAKNVFFSEAHFVEGLPRATLKKIIDAWDADTALLAEDAASANGATK